MKNRKKIFIFVLLLCTIFSTLLFISPTTKAEVIDLTNTTWQFYNTIDFIGSERFDTYYINFTDNSQNQYESIAIINGNFYGTYINYDDIAVYDTSSWVNENYTIINIIDGEDVSNSDLIDFMLTNASLITPSDPTYTISGGYQFYPIISSSIFGDISEQELDILLEGNFWLYGNDNVQWDMFTLHTLSSDDTALYFCYESSIFNKYNYAGVLINNNNQIQLYLEERTIYFEEQQISEEVYNWLSNNGKFGNYDDTLPAPSPDNPFGFVVDMVNDFLQIEFLPGFKFIHLLYIGVSIPLLMYILKLFLGG